jgi:pimeloyl-ACP methyl ester carboxylesterase
MLPETRYVRSQGYHIAYQVGEGRRDVILIPGFGSHLEVGWEQPLYERWFRRVSSYARLILVDKRGTGLSDKVPNDRLPTLEERMDDVLAVLDAVGSERTALFGISEGGAMASLFAATYPSRTSALILSGAWARAFSAPDYPWGFDPSTFQQLVEAVQRAWGTPASAAIPAPSLANDGAFAAWWAKYNRMAASPGAVGTLMRMAFEGDVRSILPSISCPTLVVHRTHDPFVDVRHGRYLAARIPGARLVEFSGSDHLHYVGDTEDYNNEIELFLTGELRSANSERMLATVLFTDIVESTKHLATLGDKRWAERLTQHNNVVRHQLQRFRGREIDTTGDGFLASFDGPARAVRCAKAIVDDVRSIGFQVRAGVHTGECEVVGEKLAGIAVHVGARVMAQAKASEVLVSGTVKDLVAGSGLDFESRGWQVLKGVPGEWHILALRWKQE